MAVTDAELVRASLAGSERAFHELVRRYERPVFAVIVRMVRDPSRAEELAQDTFVKAFLRLDTYSSKRKFASWLLAIAHHLTVDELRRQVVQTEPLEEAHEARAGLPNGGGETPAAIAERRELATALDAAIRKLRPEYAELIVLRYEQDLTLEEVAEVTSLPIGTIKSYLYRARKELAECMRTAGWSAGRA